MEGEPNMNAEPKKAETGLWSNIIQNWPKEDGELTNDKLFELAR